MTENPTPKNPEETRDPRLEALFEQAVEDLSAYGYAVRALEGGDGEGPADYLLELLLASRARGRQALERISRGVPQEYAPYGTRLERLWKEAEAGLDSYLETRGEEARALLKEALPGRLKRLENRLAEVRRLGQDGDLFQDPEWVAEDLSECAGDFALGFARASRAAEEALNAPFDRMDSEGFRESVRRVDGDFQKDFGYTAPLAGLLQWMGEREYSWRPWWLSREPRPEEVADARMPGERLEELGQVFRHEAATAAKDCPRMPEAVAYALEELSADQVREMREHMASCRACRRLALDLRAASAEDTDQIPPGLDVRDPAVEEEPGVEHAGPDDDTVILPISALPRHFPVRLVAVLTLVLALGVAVFALWAPLRNAVSPPQPLESTEYNAPEVSTGDTGPVFDPGPRKPLLAIRARRPKGAPMGGVWGGFQAFTVKPGEDLKSGDGFRVYFTVDKPSHVYLFFEDSGGRMSGLLRGVVRPGKTFSMPERNTWYTLDHQAGTETVWMLAASRPIQDFDQKLDELEKKGAGDIAKIFPDAARTNFSFHHIE